ncbi:MAG: hypothetical protein UR98_C0002G0001, partial [Parcubacteria group bacterium GW2011_GWA1_36_12]
MPEKIPIPSSVPEVPSDSEKEPVEEITENDNEEIGADKGDIVKGRKDELRRQRKILEEMIEEDPEKRESLSSELKEEAERVLEETLGGPDG